MRRLLTLALLLSLAIPAGSACGQERRPRAAAASADQRPLLVVLLTVDQMRPDYFERFASQLDGGLARLYRGGAVFTNAWQDHANTETAPGHSATLSGRFPYSTGIVSNAAGVQDPQAPLIGADGPGASPFRFRGSTLVDWLRVADPRSRALSVSRKDRGAILPIGREPQAVFWYAANGTFTTSTYYADTLPAWVQQFNARHEPQSYAGKAWTTLLDSADYPEPDDLEQGSAGTDVLFPHAVPAEPEKAAAALPNFPYMDEVTLDIAIDGVSAMGLGVGPQTDLLAVSLSTTDAVGHAFGPDSRELHDQIVRLDRELGDFLDSLFAMRDSTRIIIALTADHGVTPYPRVREKLGKGKAVFYGGATQFRKFLTDARDLGMPADAVSIQDGVLFLDRRAAGAAHVSADSVVTAFIAMARAIPGVMRVDRVSSLARADTVKDRIARRWLHALPREMPAEVVVTMQPFAYPEGATYAQHGSPHDPDAHVPLIFYGAPFKPGKYDAFARVVDLAPTLAVVVGVPVLERLDGHALRSVIR